MLLASKIWFITGSSRGFGRQFVTTALDVTDKAAVIEAVQRAHDHFGRLDVVVNNAGCGLFGAVEELTEQQVRDQMETNFFGALWVAQAVLPLLRARPSPPTGATSSPVTRPPPARPC
ncbi:SDR family NAD(P)-dependent oxidoreductase [Streptomyces sp. NPDC006132]|uniref:SDR family NAD(P)-dependent oxidoreductase n=1 Tax=Streptomyces sp. NPDC006132 TaxID=3156732 RepID=UPI0033EA3212